MKHVIKSAVLLAVIAGFHHSANALPICGPGAVDPDGDGYGWNNPGSCIMPTGDDGGSGGVCPSGDGNRFEITDVIVTAGQSNAVANSSAFNNDETDSQRCSNKVYVWHNNKWTYANLNTQKWLSQSRLKQAHGGFQIAKQINDKNSNKVIGIVPSGTNGESISHWVNGQNNFNSAFWNINWHVGQALGKLPSISKVSMIWWMQGEADEGNSNYSVELDYLIEGFSGRGWFDQSKLFVANEIRKNTNVNVDIRALNGDADQFAQTCSSRGQGLAPVGYVADYGNGDSGNDNVHFNSASFRTIGNEVANRFLGWTNCGSGVVVQPVDSDCDYSQAWRYGGWGWNPVTRESCPPL